MILDYETSTTWNFWRTSRPLILIDFRLYYPLWIRAICTLPQWIILLVKWPSRSCAFDLSSKLRVSNFLSRVESFDFSPGLKAFVCFFFMLSCKVFFLVCVWRVFDNLGFQIQTRKIKTDFTISCKTKLSKHSDYIYFFFLLL